MCCCVEDTLEGLRFALGLSGAGRHEVLQVEAKTDESHISVQNGMRDLHRP